MNIGIVSAMAPTRTARLANSNRIRAKGPASQHDVLWRQKQYLKRVRTQRKELEFATLAGILRVPRGVAQPKVDSHLLALAALPWTRGSVLDVFCGSGVVGLSVASRAKSCTFADINPAAVSTCAANARDLRITAKLSYVVGAIAHQHHAQKYDLIVASPPYTDHPTYDLVDSICFDPAHAALHSLLERAAGWLTSHGLLMLNWANYVDFAFLERLLAANSFNFTISATTQEPSEKGMIASPAIEYRIYRCWPVR
jgi:methylase of polypeptide subunit release factors